MNPPLQGKVCLVTGATSGIGLVTARELARQGARVVLVGRNPDKTTATLRHIQTQTGNPNVDMLLADLSSQAQIRELARQFRERYPRLDVLVNNAGGIWMKRQLTVDGLEMTFAVNHLAYFLLTHLLLETLQASAPARIVNVASEAHRGVTLDFDNLQGEHRYGAWPAYRRSKLANLLFTYELAPRLEGTGVTVNALHPGWVATGFGGNNAWIGPWWKGVARLFALTPEQGARTVLYLVTSPNVAGLSGRYFVREKEVSSSPASYDQAAARRLWQVSLEMTHLQPIPSHPGQSSAR
ncbi:MAG: SDR family oxidoreductase [Planctomycetes bacterium]|nr:SDR family oxidoreductase [Planctomycetota bacterium]